MVAFKSVDGRWRDLAKAARYSVGACARLCGISTRTLRRRFQQAQGRAPKRALDEARLDEAQELLLARQPAKQFAAALRFKHAADFAAWFAAGGGTSPSQFVAEHCSRLLPSGPPGGATRER